MPAPTASNAELGRTVRALRTARGLSIEALADLADMHPTYLSGIERGRRNPSWSKLSGLASALDLPVSRIAAEAEDEARCREADPAAAR